MYNILLQSHSGIRYILLLVLLAAIVKSLSGILSKGKFTPMDDKLGIAAMAITHLQFILGLVLFFVSPIVKAAMQDMGATMKDASLRFITVEHATLMIAAVILITVGRILTKKAPTDKGKFVRTFVFFLIGLGLMIVGIPWDRAF